MSVPKASWVGAAERIEPRFWPSASGAVVFSPSWWTLNERTLKTDPLYLLLEEGGAPCALVPFMAVDDKSFEVYVPPKLLTMMLQDGPDPGAAAALASLPAQALVCTIPNGYESPLQAAPVAMLHHVAEEAEAEAARRGLSTVAFLFLGDSDGDALALLAERGYHTTVLDAAGVIDVDPAWRDLDGYFRAMRRGKELRRERRRFENAGYHVEWHREPPAHVLAAAARLEADLLQSKGHDFSVDELRSWYEEIPRRLGAKAVFITASRAGSIDAFVMCLDEGKRLVAMTTGFVRRDLLYFNIAYYEPVRYALEHGIPELEIGLAAGDAKRARGARGRRVFGAFRFVDTDVAASWPRIKHALERGYEAAWEAQASPASSKAPKP